MRLLDLTTDDVTNLPMEVWIGVAFFVLGVIMVWVFLFS